MDAPAVRYARTEDGANIAYWTVGTGRPLVILGYFPLLHTVLSWESEHFRDWIERLAVNHCVTLFDWRGTGLSDSKADFAEETPLIDVRAVIGEVAPKGCALLALASAVPIALAFAVKEPKLVDRLVLFNGYSSYADYQTKTSMTEIR